METLNLLSKPDAGMERKKRTISVEITPAMDSLPDSVREDLIVHLGNLKRGIMARYGGHMDTVLQMFDAINKVVSVGKKMEDTTPAEKDE